MQKSKLGVNENKKQKSRLIITKFQSNTKKVNTTVQQTNDRSVIKL